MAELKLELKLKILLIVLCNRTQRIFFQSLPFSNHDLFYPAKPQKGYFYSPARRWQVRLWYRLSPKEGHDKIQSMENFFSHFLFFSVTTETEHFIKYQWTQQATVVLVAPVTVTMKVRCFHSLPQLLYILKHHLCS